MTFVLEHPCGLRIERGLRESEARAVDGVIVRDMKTGYVWYGLPERELAGQRIKADLCFVQGRLDSVTFTVVDDRFGSTWTDWSESKERARAEASRAWLASVGFPVGAYDWGTVYAAFDPRGGGGGAGVRFSTG